MAPRRTRAPGLTPYNREILADIRNVTGDRPFTAAEIKHCIPRRHPGGYLRQLYLDGHIILVDRGRAGGVRTWAIPPATRAKLQGATA